MSSDLQSLLELLQLNCYTSLVAVTAVTYDYFLTFSSEINYVWCQPWTWVSTIFVLVRYVGLCWVVLGALGGTPFLTGPVEMCTALNWVIEWVFLTFLNAANLVMILRVYAMWNQSKRILYLLLFIYVPQVIVTCIFAGIYNNSQHLSMTVVQVMDFSVCSLASNIGMMDMYDQLPRFVLSATLLILALTQTLKESLNMYRATKQWQPNRYMERLARDGIVYFLVNVFYNISNLMESGTTQDKTWMYYLYMFSGITLCPMMPRFIISVREMYDRDSRRGLQGIDTGFGSLSQPNASQNAAVSAIAFADVAPGQDQVVEGDANESEAIQLVPLEGRLGYLFYLWCLVF